MSGFGHDGCSNPDFFNQVNMAKQMRRKPSASGKPKTERRPSAYGKTKAERRPSAPESTEGMRLNKYVAHCGVASRREAAEIVKQGHITVNSVVETEPFYQIKTGDIVKYKGQVIRPEVRRVYYLMNKPKNVITTTSDEKGRKTVLDLVADRVEERVFPVGRLDRDTTGLLLLTNDGELALKMTHPSYKIKKIYHATLNKTVSKEDLEKIRAGLELEDGSAPVDAADYIVERPHSEVGLTVHIGRNRIVRRIFEHLGYEVLKLDRVYLGGLTKKDLPRGFVRRLTSQEVIMLKHFTGK